ncbi:ribonuclease H2, subunit B [Bipolaris maydis]|uniref:ribonuclease H2, subunit B n=1 Tax=Cochliobolus heterostrophus TaxID=5016 RepID=UPI0024DD94C9|nr:ribonuclease H2, subunit B [Bipolaris maydis]KAJ6265224.1 ribonuclease H2, subunit B [Bipolaris maydis]KAJ6280955.1 ribonuclease H2, subunit B [Bipolaris maydis]
MPLRMGFYEFTRIAAPKKDCRSWLITSNDSTTQEQEEKEDTDASRIGSGYVAKSADLFIATPIDLLFLILPALAPKTAKDTKQHFLAFDDYLDTLSSSSPHWKALLSQHASLKSMLENRIRFICDTVDAGDETMYRISLPKLLEVLVAKAERMIQRGLPASLEEKFIKTALDIPVMNIKREESTLSAVSTSNTETLESETTTTTTTTTQEDPVTPALTTPPEIPHLLRLRTSLTYLTSSYLPPSLTSLLTPLLTPRFTPLTAHLSTIAALKAEAAALRSITDNVSRKRAVLEDDDKMAEREEKKRKKEEEDKKKKMEGRGIKQLKKVDTSGMRKMSSFFTKVDKKK